MANAASDGDCWAVVMVAGLGPSDRLVVLDDNAAAVVVAADDDDDDNSQFGSFSCRLEAPSVVTTPSLKSNPSLQIMDF